MYDETRGLMCDETRGLMYDETRGLMYGETRGLMCGETRGLMCGETRGLMYGETRGLIYGETQGLIFSQARVSFFLLHHRGDVHPIVHLHESLGDIEVRGAKSLPDNAQGVIDEFTRQDVAVVHHS